LTKWWKQERKRRRKKKKNNQNTYSMIKKEGDLLGFPDKERCAESPRAVMESFLKEQLRPLSRALGVLGEDLDKVGNVAEYLESRDCPLEETELWKTAELIKSFFDFTSQEVAEPLRKITRVLRHDLYTFIGLYPLKIIEASESKKGVELTDCLDSRGFIPKTKACLEISKWALRSADFIYSENRERQSQEIPVRRFVSGLKEFIYFVTFCKGLKCSFKEEANHLELRDVVSCHPEVVYNLLMNIISNSNKRGEATEVEIAISDEEGKSGKEDGGDFLVLEVRDDGVGIPGEMERKIFEEGFTTARNGTGIGLGGAKDLMELFGGLIEVRGHDGLPTNQELKRRKCLPKESKGALLALKIPLSSSETAKD
jgi:signal transduction histidine kinase